MVCELLKSPQVSWNTQVAWSIFSHLKLDAKIEAKEAATTDQSPSAPNMGDMCILLLSHKPPSTLKTSHKCEMEPLVPWLPNTSACLAAHLCCLFFRFTTSDLHDEGIDVCLYGNKCRKIWRFDGDVGAGMLLIFIINQHCAFRSRVQVINCDKSLRQWRPDSLYQSSQGMYVVSRES